MIKRVDRKLFLLLFFGSYAAFQILDRIFKVHVWTDGELGIEKDIASTKYLFFPWVIFLLFLVAGRLSDAGMSRKSLLKFLIPFYNLYFLIILFFIPSENRDKNEKG